MCARCTFLVVSAHKKDPASHDDLMVRVAGYSAYFVNLTPEIQDDVIERTEQDFSK